MLTWLLGDFPAKIILVAKPLSQASGIEGKKGVLWWEIYRFLRLKNTPRYVLLENVDRLLKSPASQRGRDFAINSFMPGLAWIRSRVACCKRCGLRFSAEATPRVHLCGENRWGMESCWDAWADGSDGASASQSPRPAKVAEFSTYRRTRMSALRNSCPEQKALELRHRPAPCRDAMWLRARVDAAYDGSRLALRDVLVDDDEVRDESFYITDEGAFGARWRYFKGGKSEPRVNKKTGFTYQYTEGSMSFPDPIDCPARTILTSEGGGSASRSKHVVRAKDGRYRRLVPDELDQLQGFPRGWTDTWDDGHKPCVLHGQCAGCGNSPSNREGSIAERAATQGPRSQGSGPFDYVSSTLTVLLTIRLIGARIISFTSSLVA